MDDRMTMEAGWVALRMLSDELAATHAKPFTESFFSEHGDAIQRALEVLTEEKRRQISMSKPS